MQAFAKFTLAIALLVEIPAARAQVASPTPSELKQLVPCLQLGHESAPGCPVEVFDAPADDPADRARFFRLGIEPLVRSDLVKDKSDLEDALRAIEEKGAVFKCTSSSAGSQKCAVTRKMPRSGKAENDFSLPTEDQVNFVYFYPPYSDRDNYDPVKATKQIVELVGNEP
jgi:hypothetical protein